jgi:DNA modification methylase
LAVLKPYYQDSAVTIYHGDCLEILSDLLADVLVTDPPYGAQNISGWSGLHGDCKITNDSDVGTRNQVLKTWSLRYKPAIVFGSPRCARPHGIRATLIWDKGGHAGMGDLDFPWKPNYEEIYIIGFGFSGARTSSVLSHWIHPKFNASRQHPTEKPVSLLRDLIGKCPGDTILDPFMGSGTTLRAAKDLGRKAIGIEIEERYCEIAAKRMAQEVLAFS